MKKWTYINRKKFYKRDEFFDKDQINLIKINA